MTWAETLVNAIFDPLFGWMLNLPSLLAIFLLALFLGLVSTLLQKYLTDQAKMKRLRDDTKKLQKQYQALAKTDPEKALKLQQKMMPLQLDLMKESFKPLLVTMIPFLMIFFWLSMHFAYYPVTPGVPFVVQAQFVDGLAGEATLVAPNLTVSEPTAAIAGGVASWTVQGPQGRHSLAINYSGALVTRDVLITTEREYIQPELPMRGAIESFDVQNEKLLPIPGFNLFGWYPGWIFYYIILSIPISLGLRKLLNVV
jgi:uncharacterized membrane protein (DUF106 family)